MQQTHHFSLRMARYCALIDARFSHALAQPFVLPDRAGEGATLFTMTRPRPDPQTSAGLSRNRHRRH